MAAQASDDVVLKKDGVEKAVRNIVEDILDNFEDLNDLVLIGIRTRGVPLAKRIVSLIKAIKQKEISLGILDITLYRDDFSAVNSQPVVHRTEIPFDLTKKKVILVDDVIFTGRTVRAALDALIDFGRPDLIKLAVLVDRGHRELPIRPDFTGKQITTKRDQKIEVVLKEIDGRDGVFIYKKKDID